MLWNLHRSPEEQNWDEVETVLERAEKLSPNDGQIKLLMAEMLVDRGQATEGRGTDQAAPRRFAQGRRVLDRPGQSGRPAGKDGARPRRFSTKPAAAGRPGAHPPRPSPDLPAGNGLQAGAEIEKLADDADAFSPEEKIRLWNGLLNNLLEIREYDRAKRLCRQIAREQPHDAMIRYRLFELALATHDARDPAASLAELDRVLEEIDVIAGQGPLWMYGKAVRLKLEAAQGKPELLDAAMDYADAGAGNAAVLVAAPGLEGRNLPPTRQPGGGPGVLLAGLDQRRSRSGVHPPVVANALRAAALPGRRAGDPTGWTATKRP